MKRLKFGQKLFLAEDGKVITALYCGVTKNEDYISVCAENEGIQVVDKENVFASRKKALDAYNKREIARTEERIDFLEDRIKEFKEELEEDKTILAKLKAG